MGAKKKKTRRIFFVLSLILSALLQGAVWTGNDPAFPTDWNRPANWDTGVPSAADTAWFSLPDRPSPILTGFANPLNMVVGAGNDIGSCQPRVATGGELKMGTTPNLLWVGYYGGKGKLILDGGLIWNVSSLILADGTAATEGVVEIKDGVLNLTEGPRIGWSGKGRLTLSGGTINCSFAELGVQSGSEGLLEVSGGAMNISGNLIAGVAANTQSSVVISGGTVSTGAGSVVDIGSAVGSTATMHLSGGVFNYNHTARFAVGFGGSGTLTVSGNATLYIGGRLRIGVNAGSVGRVHIVGGAVRVANDITFGGNALLNIEGDGVLILDGDKRKLIMTAVSNKQLVAYNGAGGVMMDYNKTEAGKTTVRGMLFDAGRTAPLDFYVFDLRAGGDSNNEMIATLAGLVNRNSPELVLGGSKWDEVNAPEYWLTDLAQYVPIRIAYYSGDPAWFINRYKSLISGYVRYDAASINRATSLAGVLNGIIVNDSTLSLATAAGLTQIADARGMTDAGIYNAYAAQWNKNYYINLATSYSYRHKDFSVANKVFIAYEPSNINTILNNLNNHSRVFGYGPDERSFFQKVSDYNQTAVVGENIIGMSAFSKWDTPRKAQKTHTSPAKPTEPDVHYVAFVMSDGDNLAFLRGAFVNSADYYASPLRGTFTMNYDMTPSTADLHPLLMNYLYDKASRGANKDYFITAGGQGICFPSRLPDKAGYAVKCAQAMALADHNIISILDESYNTTVMNHLTAQRQILGGVYKTWSGGYKDRNGQITWHNGKPIVSIKYSLWDGIQSKEYIKDQLNAQPRSPLTNTGSYSIVNVHPWSPTPMQNVKWIVDNLHPKVRVVTVEELMIHLRRHFGTPVPYPVLPKIAQWWLSDNCNADNGWCEESDLDGDGKVSLPDFALYAERWHLL